jgi:exocyst complex component 3
MPAKELESSFEIVEMVLSLLRPSKSLAFLSFWSFAKMHGPNLAFVELMEGRGDLDRLAVNEVIDSIKRKGGELDGPYVISLRLHGTLLMDLPHSP